MIEGQLSIFDIVEIDANEELIKRQLCRGSGFVDGKYRIKTYIERNERMSEFAKWLSKEYGIGGYEGVDGGNHHNAKGLEVYRRSDNIKIHLSWAEVAGRLIDLVAKGIYYTQRDEEQHQRNLKYRLEDVKNGSIWWLSDEQKQRVLNGDLSLFENIRYLTNDDGVKDEENYEE